MIGVGAQGLLMCLALQRRGVSVVAADVNEDRVAFAASLRAEALAGGDPTRRFELIVDTAGASSSVDLAVERAEIGGTIVELSLERPAVHPRGADARPRRQLVLRGSLTYDHPADFRATVDLLAGGTMSRDAWSPTNTRSRMRTRH